MQEHECTNISSRLCSQFFLGVYLRVQLLDHMVILFFIFWVTVILLPIVGISFTFPPAVHKDSNFPCPCQYFFEYFENSHSNGYEVVCHCGFGFHFPNYQWYWASFLFFFFFAICISSLEICGFVSFAQILLLLV